MRLVGTAVLAVLGIACMVVATAPAAADPTAFCVSCVEPARTYVCRVNTPDNDPGESALQFYCIVRTAREEGHKSCSVSKQLNGVCSGIEKTYTYRGPGLPSGAHPDATGTAMAPAPLPVATPPAVREDDKPETLVGLTSDGLRATSKVVRNAAGSAGKAVKGVAKGTGHAARSAGSRVGDAARSATSAVRGAVGCVWSLFSDCSAE